MEAAVTNGAIGFLDVCSDLTRTGTSKHSAEDHGACPFCGGTDRFVVWPEQGETGRGWCRQCGWQGDAIQLLRDRDGLNFAEAKRTLGLSVAPALPEKVQEQRRQRHALKVAQETFRA